MFVTGRRVGRPTSLVGERNWLDESDDAIRCDSRGVGLMLVEIISVT